MQIVEGRKKPEGEPIKDYYPRIIDDRTFDAVQVVLKKRQWMKGRSNRGENLFIGIIKSLINDSPLHYSRQVVKANGKNYDHRYLLSYSRLQGWSKETAINYLTFESAFFTAINEIDPTKILTTNDRAAMELQAAQYELAGINEKMAATREQIKAHKKSVALLELLVAQEQERDEINARIEQLRAEAHSSQSRLWDEIKELMAQPDARLKIANNVRLLVERINVLCVPIRRGQHRRIQYALYVEVVFHNGNAAIFIADQDGALREWTTIKTTGSKMRFIRSNRYQTADRQTLTHMRRIVVGSLIENAGDEWKPGLMEWLSGQ